MRTFVAVELEKNLIETIDNFIFKTYREIDSNKISWVKKENLHVTLKFLGEINEKQVEVVKNVLSNIAKKTKSFVITVDGIGVFPKITSPRVIWLGIKDGEKELNTLANTVEEELYKYGFEKEKKNFVAHLTIARIKKVNRLNDIINYVEKHKNIFFGNSKISHITFFESVLKPEGPEYKVIDKFQLEG